MDLPDAFRKQVQGHQKDFRQIQDSVLYARKIISTEKDIGPGQCSRIVNTMRSVEEPLREFYELLDTPELLPLPARSLRHSLLIILDNANKLLHELMYNISSLHVIYRTSSYQEANLHRQQILDQLETLIRRKDDIVQDIDRLLLKTNANR